MKETDPEWIAVEAMVLAQFSRITLDMALHEMQRRLDAKQVVQKYEAEAKRMQENFQFQCEQYRKMLFA